MGRTAYHNFLADYRQRVRDSQSAARAAWRALSPQQRNDYAAGQRDAVFATLVGQQQIGTAAGTQGSAQRDAGQVSAANMLHVASPLTQKPCLASANHSWVTGAGCFDTPGRGAPQALPAAPNVARAECMASSNHVWAAKKRSCYALPLQAEPAGQTPPPPAAAAASGAELVKYLDSLDDAERARCAQPVPAAYLRAAAAQSADGVARPADAARFCRHVYGPRSVEAIQLAQNGGTKPSGGVCCVPLPADVTMDEFYARRRDLNRLAAQALADSVDQVSSAWRALLHELHQWQQQQQQQQQHTASATETLQTLLPLVERLRDAVQFQQRRLNACTEPLAGGDLDSAVCWDLPYVHRQLEPDTRALRRALRKCATLARVLRTAALAPRTLSQRAAAASSASTALLRQTLSGAWQLGGVLLRRRWWLVLAALFTMNVLPVGIYGFAVNVNSGTMWASISGLMHMLAYLCPLVGTWGIAWLVKVLMQAVLRIIGASMDLFGVLQRTLGSWLTLGLLRQASSALQQKSADDFVRDMRDAARGRASPADYAIYAVVLGASGVLAHWGCAAFSTWIAGLDFGFEVSKRASDAAAGGAQSAAYGAKWLMAKMSDFWRHYVQQTTVEPGAGSADILSAAREQLRRAMRANQEAQTFFARAALKVADIIDAVRSGAYQNVVAAEQAVLRALGFGTVPEHERGIATFLTLIMAEVAAFAAPAFCSAAGGNGQPQTTQQQQDALENVTSALALPAQPRVDTQTIATALQFAPAMAGIDQQLDRALWSAGFGDAFKRALRRNDAVDTRQMLHDVGDDGNWFLDARGMTPLVYAALHGADAAVAVLLQERYATRAGRALVQGCVLSDKAACLPGSLLRDVRVTPLVAAVAGHHADVVQKLLPAAGGVNTPVGNRSPLQWALHAAASALDTGAQKNVLLDARQVLFQLLRAGAAVTDADVQLARSLRLDQRWRKGFALLLRYAHAQPGQRARVQHDEQMVALGLLSQFDLVERVCAQPLIADADALALLRRVARSLLSRPAAAIDAMSRAQLCATLIDRLLDVSAAAAPFAAEDVAFARRYAALLAESAAAVPSTWQRLLLAAAGLSAVAATVTALTFLTTPASQGGGGVASPTDNASVCQSAPFGAQRTRVPLSDLVEPLARGNVTDDCVALGGTPLSDLAPQLVPQFKAFLTTKRDSDTSRLYQELNAEVERRRQSWLGSMQRAPAFDVTFEQLFERAGDDALAQWQRWLSATPLASDRVDAPLVRNVALEYALSAHSALLSDDVLPRLQTKALRDAVLDVLVHTQPRRNDLARTFYSSGCAEALVNGQLSPAVANILFGFGYGYVRTDSVNTAGMFKFPLLTYAHYKQPSNPYTDAKELNAWVSRWSFQPLPERTQVSNDDAMNQMSRVVHGVNLPSAGYAYEVDAEDVESALRNYAQTQRVQLPGVSPV